MWIEGRNEFVRSAPVQVINKLEAIRSHFSHGVDPSVRKLMLVKWNNVLASKGMGGLGVSSFYAFNRAFIFKWVWRFCTQDNSIWTKVIKALHSEEGNLDWPTTAKFPSNWLDIIRSFSNLYNNGVDLQGSIKKKVGNEENTMFLMNFGRAKRNIRGGAEQVQMASLLYLFEGLILPILINRWMWSISGDEEFSVSSVRNYSDDKILGTVSSKTQWCKFVPIKVNILSWRIKLNNLLTRLNLSHRGLELQTILCPSCNLAVESTYHLFYSCSTMKDLYASIAKWWDVNMPEFSSFEEWCEWFSNFSSLVQVKDAFGRSFLCCLVVGLEFS
nr:RNA-directed DNA polymerase, eukaryota, reverse transcriptase zinc-binding domain protein [Tanacetum cinerariifolium]